MVINLRTPNSNYLERTDTLMRFYEDIRRYDILSIEEEKELIEMYQHGSKEEKEFAKNELITRNQKFVVAAAKRYATNDNILDLINEGNLGLIEALDTFKVGKGCDRFMSWAVWNIKRSINNYCIKYGNVVRKNNLSKTYHVISQATNKFIQREFRQPTLEELSKILMEEYKVKINNLGDILETKITSIDETCGSDDDNNLGDIIIFNNSSSSYNDYEKTTDNDFNKTLTKSLLNKLSEREKTIIMMSFGLGEYDREYEINEIADKLSLTPERVRQLKINVINQIKENYKEALNSI